LCPLEVELDAFGLFLRQQWIEIAEPLDEAAVAGRAAVGHHDVVDRTLLGSGARKTNFQRHCLSCPSQFSVRLSVLTSSFPARESRRGRGACRPRGPEARPENLAAGPGFRPAAAPRRRAIPA